MRSFAKRWNLKPSLGLLALILAVVPFTLSNDFYYEMQEGGVLDKVALVYGQMNEPPGNRLRVALTGLTIGGWNFNSNRAIKDLRL